MSRQTARPTPSSCSGHRRYFRQPRRRQRSAWSRRRRPASPGSRISPRNGTLALDGTSPRSLAPSRCHHRSRHRVLRPCPSPAMDETVFGRAPPARRSSFSPSEFVLTVPKRVVDPSLVEPRSRWPRPTRSGRWLIDPSLVRDGRLDVGSRRCASVGPDLLSPPVWRSFSNCRCWSRGMW